MGKRKWLAFFLAAVLLLTAIPWSSVMTVSSVSYENELVANWDLSSDNGLSQCQKISFVNVSGVDEKVAKFSGTGNNTSFIKLPKDSFSAISASTGLTISLWFNADKSTGEWSRLFDFGYSEFSNNPPFIFMTPKMKFSYNSKNSSWMQGEGAEVVCDMFDEIDVDYGVWNHAVVSLTATNISLYLNGNKVAEAENDNRKILNTMGNNYNSFDLGRSKFSADTDYVGYMRDVSIYKTALTAGDVADLYKKDGGTGAINTPSPYEAHDMDASKNSDSSIKFPSAPTPYTPDGNKRQWVHDPSLIKASDGYYYMYSTGLIPNNRDVEIRRSKDMIDWNYVGVAGLMPANSEVSSFIQSNLWAPEVYKYNNEYRMYYSCSGVAGGTSCIALATSSKPEGPFVHKGIVVKSTNAGWANGGVNAIDANIICDTDGKMYMVWGSFFGGIKIAEMNAATGYLKSSDKNSDSTSGTIIAKRPQAYDNGACEGPFVFYNDETKYYYVVVSCGNLLNEDRGAGSYSMRIGRSKSITGPYKDYNGKDMTDLTSSCFEVGYKLATNHKFNNSNGWMCIGGNSVYKENGKYWCVAHAREGDGSLADGSVYLNIRQMFWTEDGWPLCNPSLYAGESEQKVSIQYVPGNYERIEFSYTKEGRAVTSKTLKIYPDYKVSVNSINGTWSYSGSNKITITLGDKKEEYKIIPSWDWEKKRATYVIIGIDTANGLQRWGKKTAYYDWVGEIPTPSVPTSSPSNTQLPSNKPANSKTPTGSPDTTKTPTDKPNNTGAPANSPNNSTAPTNSPSNTQSPSNKPNSTNGPTNVPDSSSTPTKKPDASSSATPTKEPNKPDNSAKPSQPSSALKGTVSLTEASRDITKSNTDKGDPKGSVFAKLRLNAKGGKKSVKLSWAKVKGAKGYIVYGSACGKKMEQISKVSSAKKSITIKKLKRGKYYKYIVVAYKIIGGQTRVCAQSKSVHVCTAGGKVANPVKVITKKKLTLKKGKSKKISAKLRPAKKVKIHIAKFRYESTNKKIATVDKKGKIKAKKKGSCVIYVYAQNGLYVKVRIKVK